MQFVSVSCLFFFFPVTLGIYHIMPKRWKSGTMLIISILFLLFGGLPAAIVLLLLTVGTFGAGILLEHLQHRRKLSGLFLGGVIVLEAAALFLLRSDWMQNLKWNWLQGSDLFPVGMSFCALQSISYLADVRRKKCCAEHNWTRLALYLLFYPRLILGPVVPYEHVPSTRCSSSFSLSRIGIGCFRLLAGLAKNLVLADWIQQLPALVFADETGMYSVWVYWLSAFAQLLSLYVSLSGYADMAIGMGLCYGVKLPESYGKTLFYPGITGFAAQWNRTVVQWFSHYVGTHFHGKSQLFHVFAVILTWGCVGLWYGFRLTTLLWGMILGLCMGVEYLIGNRERYTGFRYAITLVLLCPLMLMLTAKNLPAVLSDWKALFQLQNFFPTEADIQIMRGYVLILLAGVLVASGVLNRIWAWAEQQKWFYWVRIPALLLCSLALLLSCTAALISKNGAVALPLLL